MGLIERIGRGPAALNTAIFVYFIEEHPDYLPLVEPVFLGIDRRRWSAATSSLTLLETVLVPYRAGDAALAARYEALLTRNRGLRLVPVDLAVLRAAAQLRATYGVRTPGAIQLAAGLAAECRVFITNDRELPPAIGDMEVLQLSNA